MPDRTDPFTPDVLVSLRAIAVRHSRVPDDADDLLQDALLEAVRAGRHDLSQAINYRWVVGTLRNLGAMTARSAVRRRMRESAWASAGADHASPPQPADALVAAEPPAMWRDHPVIRALPPSLHAVAMLALAGHDRAEIMWLLRISPEAMRQRISQLGRTLRRELGDRDGLPIAQATASDLPLGLIRRALLPVAVATNAAGVHDPDGHLLMFGRTVAHVSGDGGNRDVQSKRSSPFPPEPDP